MIKYETLIPAFSSVGFKNLEIFSLVTRLLSLRDVEPGHNGTIGFWEGLLD